MAWFSKGKEGFLAGDIDADAHHLRAKLIDVNTAGPTAGAYVVSTATQNGTTVTLTMSQSHGMTTGDKVEVFSVGGIVNANGVQTISGTTSTQITYTPVAGTPSSSYTSGGFALDLSIQFESELNVSGTAIIAEVEIPTSGRSVTNGILDLPDATFTNVTGASVEAFVIEKVGTTPTGAQDAASARRLILAQTAATSGLTGLPVTPNGGNINLTFASQGVGEL